MHKITFGLLMLTVTVFGCASSHGGAPLAFSEADVPREPTPSSNWSLPAERAEEILRSAPVEIRAVQGAGAGVTGAQKVDLIFEIAEQEEDEVYLWEIDGDVDLKAKPFPSPKLDGWNNNPRKEIAAYEVQKTGTKVLPEIMVPLVSYAKELELQKAVIEEAASPSTCR